MKDPRLLQGTVQSTECRPLWDAPVPEIACPVGNNGNRAARYGGSPDSNPEEYLFVLAVESRVQFPKARVSRMASCQVPAGILKDWQLPAPLDP